MLWPIRITTPPTKLNYTDGETIDYTGMVVTAYRSDGTAIQTVPLSEITLNPTVASFSSESDEWTDGNGVNCVQMSLVATTITSRSTMATKPYDGMVTDSAIGTIMYDGIEQLAYLGGMADVSEANLLLTQYNNAICVCRINGSFNKSVYPMTPETHTPREKYHGEYYAFGGTSQETVMNKFVKLALADIGGVYHSSLSTCTLPVSTVDPTKINFNTLYSIPSDSASIEVLWPRHEDGVVLSDSFTITASTPITQ